MVWVKGVYAQQAGGQEKAQMDREKEPTHPCRVGVRPGVVVMYVSTRKYFTGHFRGWLEPNGVMTDPQVLMLPTRKM